MGTAEIILLISVILAVIVFVLTVFFAIKESIEPRPPISVDPNPRPLSKRRKIGHYYYMD